MTTDWTSPDVAAHYEEYDPVRERALAYPLMFDELGLDQPDRRTVLDYGCGTGRVAERMVREYGVSVVAADPSPGMLAVAKAKRPIEEIAYQLIADDQKLDLPDAHVDAAISCFVYVCISSGERIQQILAEVYRVLRPGARYAMLELNPDSIGIPFQVGQMGMAGETYEPGEVIPVRLTVPGAEPMEISDYHWPRDVHREFLREAGFRNIQVHEPTLPDGFDGPGAELMLVERKHAPYIVYVAEKA